MKLDYGTLQSPGSIKLTLGTIRKPTLGEIFDDLGYESYQTYEAFLKMTPKLYYEKIKVDGEDEWNSFDKEAKAKMTIYDIIEIDKSLEEIYSLIFDFFFEEQVKYIDGAFFLLIDFDGNIENITNETVKGIIFRDNFEEILDILRQICCIKSDNDEKKSIEEEKPKFKNALAEKLWNKMHNAEIEKTKNETKFNINYSIPNIISAVANRHPSINYTNIFGLTMFQLLECFDRLRTNESYNISSTTVSVWGSKDNKFEADLWYKNNFDSQ